MKTCLQYLSTAISSIFFRIFILLVIGISTFSTFTVQKAEAVLVPSGHFPVKVSAAIGQYYISLSGFIAPYASVVLTTDGVVMRSTAADATGHFSMSQILVKQGFSHFCLDAVDVKRLGQSEACFNIPPVTRGTYDKSNIFLPPTIGLFRTEINAGDNAIIWGYSMPGALVSVHASDGSIYSATADKEGFYQVNTKIAKAGTYELYATATYQKQNSEKPTNKVKLIALTFGEQVNKSIGNSLKNLLTFLFNLPLGPLWLAIPIIILIFILYRKLKGLPIIPTTEAGNMKKFFYERYFHPRKLHHSWMKGIGF